MAKQCKSRARGGRRVQSKSETRKVYGVIMDQPVVESKVLVLDPFQVVNNNSSSLGFGVTFLLHN